MAVIQSLNVLLQCNTKPFQKGMSIASSALSGLTGMIGGLSVGAFATWGVKLAGEAEAAQVGFATMLGSADAARSMVGSLMKMGAETPFESSELIQGARSLLSFGVAAGDVQSTLKTLGDVASGSQSEITDLALIYGKTLAKGVFSQEQGHQYAERGIPIYATLAKQLGVTTQELLKQITAGKVSAAHVKTALESMAGSGGIFEDAMKKQSGTLLGLWSTLTDGVTMVATDVGQLLVEAFNLKGVTSSLTGVTDTIRSTIAEWKPTFFAFVDVTKAAFSTLLTGIAAVWNGIVSVATPVLEWLLGVGGATFTSFKDLVLETFWGLEFAWTHFGDVFWLGVDKVMLGAMRMGTYIRGFFKYVYDTGVNTATNLLIGLTNIKDTLITLFKEIWDYVKSAGKDPIEFKIDPIPMGNWLGEFDAGMTETEQALSDSINARGDSMLNSLGKFVEQKQTDLQATLDKVNTVTGPAAPADQPAEETATGSTKDKLSPAALEQGSVAAFSAINAFKKNDPVKDAVDKVAKGIEKVASKLDKIATNTSDVELVANF